MTYCSVLVLVGLTKKRFGHYAILNILSLKSPRKLAVGLKVLWWPCDENFRTLRGVIHDVIAPEEATKT